MTIEKIEKLNFEEEGREPIVDIEVNDESQYHQTQGQTPTSEWKFHSCPYFFYIYYSLTNSHKLIT